MGGRKFLIHVGGASLHFGIIMGNGFDVASTAAGWGTIGERVLQKTAVCYCILVPQVVIRPPVGETLDHTTFTAGSSGPMCCSNTSKGY